MFHADTAVTSPPAATRPSAPSGAGACDPPSAAYERLAASGLEGPALLARALRDELPGDVAAVSSFGADSTLLLAMIAEIDPDTPVLFLETRRHFPETLAFRDDVARHLGLTNVRDLVPDERAAADADPTGELWFYDPDACCALRKVRPLAAGLRPFRGWITGRKRFQSAGRARLPSVELADGRLKINPLAAWDADRIENEVARRGLPRHPLVAEGYRSIGCAPCTRAVRPGEDDRAGRWHGLRKTECGIHGPN